MTVSHAYRGLIEEEVIETKPGIGTFVAELGDVNGQRARMVEKSFVRLSQRFLQEAMALGYAPREACEALQQQSACRDEGRPGPRLALVGNFRDATESYAREMETMLRDLEVRVNVVLLPTLQADLESTLPRLMGTQVVISLPSRLQEVRGLLAPHGFDVVAVRFKVSNETRRRVAEIPPHARLGVVATYPQYVHSLLEGVVCYSFCETQPLSAYLGQEEAVREMLQQVDIVVYASGSDRIREWLPEGVQAFEYRHAPDADSLNRLRSLFAD
jgi:hypothetical protein